MADNIDVTPGLGKTIGADDVGGILYQRVKMVWGVDGVANDASATNPVPVIASPVAGTSAAVTSVGASATSVPLLAANAARRGAFIYNDSTVALNVKMGATASATSFTVKLLAGGYWEMPTVPYVYTGTIDGIWDSATGSARITELG